jgi:hypothetical protein
MRNPIRTASRLAWRARARVQRRRVATIAPQVTRKPADCVIPRRFMNNAG